VPDESIILFLSTGGEVLRPLLKLPVVDYFVLKAFVNIFSSSSSFSRKAY